ncbi:MAG: type II secretion system protein [Phycisphaerales bacterium]|mgnify:FL=1|jgi:prepilin-type N-terminal cleavage/methylation domain-containing protein|nr:type II secretion system protein [Phycisphaerales bacterium]MDP7086536.1 type II secretion system protein [Phycisphaerales bacterium]MDP7189267.1 type II secretion system protein [Phycisphaerales bacterium]MDP7520261.1 type II secretion system protein [Phycisphaerales bacterium]MDP7574444.1 type II secretion system protein [Phycisphaerales bacterium]|tara:strand:- start:16 stop:618 length:603 start_codon:yes stop_codon:yes gene_type:complete
MRTSRNRPRHTGFTLIEVIVVTVLMAMLAVVLVSRLTGGRSREFDLATEQVSDLMLMYAIRSEFADEPVGISMDPERNSLQLVIRRGERDEFNDGWQPDRSVREVRLPEFLPVQAMEFLVEGDWVDPSDKPITNLPGQPRPSLEVTLQSDDPRNPRSVRLTLNSCSLRPLKQDSMRNEPNSSVPRTAIDLDTSGRWQEDW